MCGRSIGRRTGFLLLVSVMAAASVAADEFPSLKPGLWEYQKTKIPAPGGHLPPSESVRRCTDPTADMKRKWAQLAAGDCRFSPIAHAGKRYQYRSVCRREGVEVLVSSVVTVENENSYQVKTQSRASGGTSNEVVVARRLDDCVSSDQVTARGARTSLQQ